jgi:hypothetical protein
VAKARGYPEQRERVAGPTPQVAEKFERYETITFTLAAVATVQEAGQFSGRPDAIDLLASAAGVDVFLTDELGREESAIRLPANDWFHSEISKRRVRVQDPTGTGLQVVRAVGKWASRGD